MNLTAAEKETIARYDNEGEAGSVFTYDTAVINRLIRAGVKPKRVDVYGGHEFVLPSKKWIRIAPPKRGTPRPNSVPPGVRAKRENPAD